MVPIAIVQSLANLDDIEKVLPFLKPIIERWVSLFVSLQLNFMKKHPGMLFFWTERHAILLMVSHFCHLATQKNIHTEFQWFIITYQYSVEDSRVSLCLQNCVYIL
jgi:hypothetical protein